MLKQRISEPSYPISPDIAYRFNLDTCPKFTLPDEIQQRLFAYLERVLTGDIDANELSEFVCLGEYWCGLILVLCYLVGIRTEVFQEAFMSTWDCHHRNLISAAGHRNRLRDMFRHASVPIPDTLPDVVTIWRGTSALHYSQAVRGYSWTLDRRVACWFAMRFAPKNGCPLVLRADVPRSALLYYSDDRGEAEVVCFTPGKPIIDGAPDDWQEQHDIQSEAIRKDMAARLESYAKVISQEGE